MKLEPLFTIGPSKMALLPEVDDQDWLIFLDSSLFIMCHRKYRLQTFNTLQTHPNHEVYPDFPYSNCHLGSHLSVQTSQKTHIPRRTCTNPKISWDFEVQKNDMIPGPTRHCRSYRALGPPHSVAPGGQSACERPPHGGRHLL